MTEPEYQDLMQRAILLESYPALAKQYDTFLQVALKAVKGDPMRSTRQAKAHDLAGAQLVKLAEKISADLKGA